MSHVPVLLKESLEYLAPRPGEVILDGTVGLGGHAKALAGALGPKGVFVGLDLDGEALALSKKALAGAPARVILIEENYRNLDRALKTAGVAAVDKIFLDLGLSSHQLDGSGRGFSFQKDEPLVMTFAAKRAKEYVTADDVVNDWSENHLFDIIRGFGQERFAGRIARAIVHARRKGRIETTGELAALIEENVPTAYRRGKTHPATKTFQAIRMAVNDELGALHEGLPKGFDALRAGGRMAVITFHSLEDKIVKEFFRGCARTGKGKIVTKKPVAPSRGEILHNRRARSAKLRVIEKL